MARVICRSIFACLRAPLGSENVENYTHQQQASPSSSRLASPSCISSESSTNAYTASFITGAERVQARTSQPSAQPAASAGLHEGLRATNTLPVRISFEINNNGIGDGTEFDSLLASMLSSAAHRNLATITSLETCNEIPDLAPAMAGCTDVQELAGGAPAAACVTTGTGDAPVHTAAAAAAAVAGANASSSSTSSRSSNKSRSSLNEGGTCCGGCGVVTAMGGLAAPGLDYLDCPQLLPQERQHRRADAGAGPSPLPAIAGRSSARPAPPRVSKLTAPAFAATPAACASPYFLDGSRRSITHGRGGRDDVADLPPMLDDACLLGDHGPELPAAAGHTAGAAAGVPAGCQQAPAAGARSSTTGSLLACGPPPPPPPPPPSSSMPTPAEMVAAAMATGSAAAAAGPIGGDSAAIAAHSSAPMLMQGGGLRDPIHGACCLGAISGGEPLQRMRSPAAPPPPPQGAAPALPRAAMPGPATTTPPARTAAVAAAAMHAGSRAYARLERAGEVAGVVSCSDLGELLEGIGELRPAAELAAPAVAGGAGGAAAADSSSGTNAAAAATIYGRLLASMELLPMARGSSHSSSAAAGGRGTTSTTTWQGTWHDGRAVMVKLLACAPPTAAAAAAAAACAPPTAAAAAAAAAAASAAGSGNTAGGASEGRGALGKGCGSNTAAGPVAAVPLGPLRRAVAAAALAAAGGGAHPHLVPVLAVRALTLDAAATQELQELLRLPRGQPQQQQQQLQHHQQQSRAQHQHQQLHHVAVGGRGGLAGTGEEGCGADDSRSCSSGSYHHDLDGLMVGTSGAGGGTGGGSSSSSTSSSGGDYRLAMVDGELPRPMAGPSRLQRFLWHNPLLSPALPAAAPAAVAPATAAAAAAVPAAAAPAAAAPATAAPATAAPAGGLRAASLPPPPPETPPPSAPSLLRQMQPPPLPNAAAAGQHLPLMPNAATLAPRQQQPQPQQQQQQQQQQRDSFGSAATAAAATACTALPAAAQRTRPQKQAVAATSSAAAGHLPALRALARLRLPPGGVVVAVVTEMCGMCNLATRAVSSAAASPFAPSHTWPLHVAQRAALRTAREVAAALAALHAAGVPHGCLTPSNVLLQSSAADRRGFVARLADAGSPRLAAAAAAAGATAPLSRRLLFLAPELLMMSLAGGDGGAAAGGGVCAGGIHRSSILGLQGAGFDSSSGLMGSSSSSSSCGSGGRVMPAGLLDVVAQPTGSAPDAAGAAAGVGWSGGWLEVAAAAAAQTNGESAGGRTEAVETAVEEVEGVAAACAADVYSYGMLLYVMAAGQLPYPDEHLVSALLAVAIEGSRPEWPTSVCGRPAHPALQALYADCTAADPARRPTAQQVYARVCEAEAQLKAAKAARLAAAAGGRR